MLVANRDPFHPGAHDVSSIQGRGAAPRFARATSILQIAGTLLAIPVGLGSAYSMYRANFSIEATCQSLRGNIVTMLDKSVDAGTRHMLVRRDVEAFERSCGAVDPDATAAFKALLASDKEAAPVVAAAVRPAELAPKPVERKDERKIESKTEPHPVAAVKPPAANTASATIAEPVHQDAAASDAVWLAAVRHALVSHTADTTPPVVATAVTPAPPAIHPLAREIGPPIESRAPGTAVAAPVPALPPATSVAIAPAPQVDVGHPVPPESIPDAAPATKIEVPTRSRFGNLAAQIPLVGWAFGR